jgi:hypothetical protein
MKTLLVRRALLAVIFSIGFDLAAHAQVMLSPVAVVTNYLGTFSPTAPLERMIDHSGIESNFVSGVTLFDAYFTNPQVMYATKGDGGTNSWLSELQPLVVTNSLPTNNYVDFDLGAEYQLNKIGIWNISMKDITIKVLNTLDGPEQTAGQFTNLIDRSSFTFSYSPEVLTFSNICEGRYVRLFVDAVHPLFFNFQSGYANIGEVVLSVSPVGTPLTPIVSVSLNPSGDTLLTFTGTLQSSTNAVTGYLDVQGNPQGTFTIPKGSGLLQQFFRSKN